MADADQECPAGFIEGENDESLLPIDEVSRLSFTLHQWTIQDRCHLQEQDGACWRLTQGDPEDKRDPQPEQRQAEEVAYGEDDEDLPLSRNHFEITPNPAEKAWVMRKRSLKVRPQ
jgi:hypothetical protein